MNDIERLVEMENIRQLKARYLRHLDCKDWDDWKSLFTHDVEMDFREDFQIFADHGLGSKVDLENTDTIVSGPQMLVDFTRNSLQGASTVHHAQSPEISFTGDNAAQGIWAMSDVVERPGMLLKGAGLYYDTYERHNGSWLIQKIGHKRTRMELYVRENGDWRQIK